MFSEVVFLCFRFSFCTTASRNCGWITVLRLLQVLKLWLDLGFETATSLEIVVGLRF